MHIVDTHAHIISDDPARYPHAPLSGSLPDWMGTDREIGAGKLLRLMPEAGVNQAVLVQYSSAHGYDNDYVCDTARAHSGTFVAVCTIDPLAPDAPDKLAYWVRDRGAIGIRFRAPDRQGPLDWVTSEPAWRTAEQLKIPVCVHFMQNAQAEGLPLLRRMLERFPDVSVVLDHAGNPPWSEGAPLYGTGPVRALATFPRLYIKFATINLERLEAAHVPAHTGLALLLDAYGPSRIMWGSDMPNTPGKYADMVSLMQKAMSGLSDADQAQIMGQTALAVYPQLHK
ncbi:MAG: amidohydrolase [Chloroflexi bacterium]|nr:amidohydrolase [Chloroflexota bacterium]